MHQEVISFIIKSPLAYYKSCTNVLQDNETKTKVKEFPRNLIAAHKLKGLEDSKNYFWNNSKGTNAKTKEWERIEKCYSRHETSHFCI